MSILAWAGGVAIAGAAAGALGLALWLSKRVTQLEQRANTHSDRLKRLEVAGASVTGMAPTSHGLALEEAVAAVQTRIDRVEDRVRRWHEAEAMGPAAQASASQPAPIIEAASAPVATRSALDAVAACRVLARWCREERFPSDEGVEYGSLRVAGVAAGNLDVPPTQFEDTRQLTEFARLGITGSPTAWLVPNPDAHYSPFVQKLFANLGEGWERHAASYDNVHPVRLTRRDDGTWAIT